MFGDCGVCCGVSSHSRTSQVRGRPGPFVAERPKVVFNPRTRLYVMWFTMDLRRNQSASYYQANLSPNNRRSRPWGQTTKGGGGEGGGGQASYGQPNSGFGNSNDDDEDEIQNEKYHTPR